MKNKVKKILFLILLSFIVMFIGNNAKAETAETNIDGVHWEYEIVNGNAQNVRIKVGQNFFDGTIPSELDGHTVVSIGDGNKNIMGHKDLGERTSRNTKLPSLDIVRKFVIPNTVKNINDYAFYCMGSVEPYTIPEGVLSIGKYAFSETNVGTINFTLTIPDSVTTIGEGAFSNYYTAYLLNYTQGPVTRVPERAFKRAANNIVLGSGVQIIGKYAFAFQPRMSGSVTIPSATTSIGEKAFMRSGITSLSFEERSANVNIGTEAFLLSRLTTVNLTSHVILGKGTFKSCFNLETINTPNTAAITNIPSELCMNCIALTSSQVNSLIANATKIDNGAFEACKGLVDEIVVPSTVSTMGSRVFLGCGNLTAIDIRASITAIPDYTCQGCSSLSNFTKTSAVKKIGNFAFGRCSSLTTAKVNEILTNITSIGVSAFSACTGIDGTITINTSNIDNYAFSSCTNMKAVEMPNGFTKLSESNIKYGIFSNCENLENVVLTNGKTYYLCNKMFYGCSKLPMSVVNDYMSRTNSIGSEAFMNCTSLTGELHIPSNITSIASKAFYNDTGITKIVFDDIDSRSALDIGDDSFGNIATTQEKIDLPEVFYTGGLPKMGSSSFSNVKEAYVHMNTPTKPDLYRVRWWGTNSVRPYVHFSDCKHSIDITSALPGVRLVNPDTDEVLTSTKVDCGGDFKFKLVIDENYADFYTDLVIKIVSEGEYTNSDPVIVTPEMHSGDIYTISEIERNKKIIVQCRSVGTDLVLRQYISGLNGNSLRVSRKPSVREVENGLLEYQHTKYPVVVKKDDIIKYTVRVYNEGETAGSVRKIKVHIPEGLEFVSSNEVNTMYGWVASGDNKTIITDALKDESIAVYQGDAKPNYKEVEYCLKVKEDSNTDLYMASLAEISEGNDIDSLEDSVGDVNLTDLMYTESMGSNTASYIHFLEDNVDYEDVIMKGKASTEYSLVINKVDVTTNELLDGAKFELLDANKNVIKTAFTVGGTINFGSIVSYDVGTDIYYLRESDTPIGYKKTIEGLVEISVLKKLNSSGEIEVTIYYDLSEIQDKDDFEGTTDSDTDFIPIYDESQLAQIGTGSNVTIDNHDYVFSIDEHYKLMNDIQITSANWQGIENFAGLFDGNEHTISGLKISFGNGEKIGLFKECSGKIVDLTIDGATIIGSTNHESPKIGAFVGYMTEGSLVNCHLKNSTINTSAQNVGGLIGHTKDYVKLVGCSTDSNTSIRAEYNVGGLVGCSINQIDISNCTNAANISGSKYNLGGLVGFAKVAINVEKSSNTANVVGSYSSSTGIVPSNIGGIVGYVYESTVINAKECTNSGSIVGCINVGGIVGYSEGITNLTLCENSGSIVGNYGPTDLSKYNAGGIIGHSEPKGDAYSNTMINMADGNVINLFIKNKTTKGKYMLNICSLDSTDTDNKVALAGAKFDVYNANKVAILTNEEVDENGNIEIDNNILSSLVSDVFFIKEVEAPSGYEPLVADYIMLKVEKTWNPQTEKYEISCVHQVITNMSDVVLDEKIIANANGEEMPNEAGTGEIATNPVASNRIYYKSVKTNIVSCKNSGSVQGIYDCGGIAGIARGFVEIKDCETTEASSVTASAYGAGGIVGDISIIDPGNTSFVTGCINKGVVHGKDIGGIVGVACSNINIEECQSYGNIAGSSEAYHNVGGIVGQSLYHTTITGCTTKASISGGESLGGIVGGAGYTLGSYDHAQFGFYIPNEYLRIEDCIFEGIGEYSALRIGGIIGQVTPIESFIVGCTIKDASISGTDAGGCIGTYHGAELTVERCTVQDCIISGSENGAGVVAGQGSYHGNGSGVDASWDRHILKFKDISVLGTKIYAEGRSAAGIMAIYQANATQARTFEAEFKNCDVGPSEKNERSIIDGHDHAAGILANMYFGGREEDILTCIEDCDVINTDISSDSNGIGGIFGYTWEFPGELNISNSHVKGCNLTTEKDCIGGIVGGTYGARGVVVNIDRCSTEDSLLKSNTSKVNIGGIIGEGYGHGCFYSVSNSTVTNVKVQSNPDTTYTNGAMGGIIGMTNGYSIVLEGCIVQGITFENVGTQVSFMLGHQRGVEGGLDKYITTIKGCTVRAYKKPDETLVKNTINTSALYSAGGVYGGIYTYGQVDVENIKLSDMEFNISGTAKHVGGAFADGYHQYGGNNTYKDIEVKNVSMNVCAEQVGGLAGLMLFSSGDSIFSDIDISNVTISNTRGAAYNAGGIADLNAWGRSCSFNEIDVSDVDISSNYVYLTGGFIGNVLSTCDLVFNEIDMTEIDMDMQSASGSFCMASAFIGNNTSNGKCEIKNINVSNSDIMNAGNGNIHVAGIVAGCIGNQNIHDVVIDGLTLRNDNTAVGMTGGIGGWYHYNSDIYNVTVKNSNFTGKTCVGGILGGGSANIRNSRVVDTNVSSTGEYMAYAGGVIGLALHETTQSGATIPKAEISNVTVEGTANSDKTYKVYSNICAGGIAGMNLGSIADSVVKNIIVQTNIPGNNTGDGVDDDNVVDEDNDGVADSVVVNNITQTQAIHGFFNEEAVNCTVENVTVKYGENE